VPRVRRRPKPSLLELTAFSDGQFTLTGTNGDTISGRSPGFLEQSGSTATIWGAFLIVDGTGRF
jgi:hypothetical protein